MNRKMIVSILAKLMLLEALLLLAPAMVAVYFGESFWPFLLVAAGCALIGLLGSLFLPKNQTIYTKEGFFVVGLVWVLWSLVGALPFVITGAIPNYVDAFFETASGFTTTGSSILTEIESLPKSILFWRSFTHWIGGMGVLVFLIAIVPLAQGRSMYLMKAEMPGPSADKLVPKTANTAKILYLIYMGLTLTQFILLLCGGMPVFDSAVNAFATAGTGGFSVKNAGIGAYGSPYAEWIITIFMYLFGINFNIYYLILLRRVKAALHNEELWMYLGIIVTSVTVIAFNISGLYATVSETIRTSAFQVAAVISSTGFSTADFVQWPNLSQMILFLLMFLGACAGSTGGGLKVVRLLLTCKIIRRDLRKIARPREVSCIRMDGKVVEEETLSGIKTYLLVYFAIIFGSFIFLMFEGKDVITTFTSVVTCFNNIGPGLGPIVGPAGNFSTWSAFGKIVLSFDMLLGRLEIFSILLLFMPSLWKKKVL
ncbi:MAG: TrkH family potassium uptake protein [Lachnospiraceae bacterium]|nr:TrkH family potassium uptake protein [Lachnospiraceae bacterium]